MTRTMYDLLAKIGRWVGISALLIGYSLLSYFSSTAQAGIAMPALSLSVAVFPTLAFLLWLAWHSPRPVSMLILCLVPIGLLFIFWSLLERNFSWVYLIQSVGTNILLALMFGHTLGVRHRPLISRLAESIRGPLPPAVARYTRQVTLAWTLFFAAMAMLSTLLFLFAPIEVWSLFANILAWPLVIVVFVVEYLVRRRVLPEERQHGILDGVRAYWKTARGAVGAGADSR